MPQPKVFGIGYHKTGTTSFGKALTMLGYRVCGPTGVHDPEFIRQLPGSALDKVKGWDAFQDNPWPLLYRQLDAAFPGSKFVLTTRPRDQWIRSVVKHFGRNSTPMREWIYGVGYGSPVGNEERYLEFYDRHHFDVREYFSGRDNLLEYPLVEGAGWDPLCSFLGCPTPGVALPHANKASDRRGVRKRAVRSIKSKLLAWRGHLRDFGATRQG